MVLEQVRNVRASLGTLDSLDGPQMQLVEFESIS